MSSSIRSLKAPSWVSEFRAFIMRGVVNEISGLTPIFPLTHTHNQEPHPGVGQHPRLAFATAIRSITKWRRSISNPS